MQDTEQIEVEEEVVDEALPQNEDEAPKQESKEPENVEPELDEEESGEKPSADDLEDDKGEDDSEKPEEEEELIISIEGEEPPEKEEPAPKWVKDLRKKNREQAREIKKLQAQIQEEAEKKDQPIELGKKPTPEDFDYDAEATANAIVEWNERKRKLDEQAATKKKQQAEEDQAYQEKLAAYSEARSSLKVNDYEDAEETAREALNVTQQSIIIQGAKDPALIVYALGKNPQKLKQLSGINDPIQFSMEIARLETKMKVTKRTPPPPEKVVKGTAPISGNSLKDQIEKAEARAEITRDRTEVIQLKRKLKNQTQ